MWYSNSSLVPALGHLLVCFQTILKPGGRSGRGEGMGTAGNDLCINVTLSLMKIKKGERIILTGSGPTVTKAITCAEIIKRKIRVSHEGMLQL